MSLVTMIYRQFQKPAGLPGRLVGWIMASRPSNIERSRWTVERLQVLETDHVLEIGFGPGMALERVTRLAPKGRVVGVDHSPLMLKRALRRNRAAVDAGLVELKLGGLDLLPRLGETFDKVFSVNVLQFLPERTEALKLIRSILRPNGLLATTVQPRHLGAKAEDAQAFADRLSQEMTGVGFRDIATEQLDLKPVPAVCVLGRSGISG